MTYQITDVIDSFESTFADRQEIPTSLEMIWFKKSVARFNVEFAAIEYNDELGTFTTENMNPFIIDVLAKMMKVLYMERQISKNNKIVSIVGKDLSVNGTNGLQKFSKEEYDTNVQELQSMIEKLKTTAYI